MHYFIQQQLTVIKFFFIEAVNQYKFVAFTDTTFLEITEYNRLKEMFQYNRDTQIQRLRFDLSIFLYVCCTRTIHTVTAFQVLFSTGNRLVFIIIYHLLCETDFLM